MTNQQQHQLQHAIDLIEEVRDRLQSFEGEARVMRQLAEQRADRIAELTKERTVIWDMIAQIAHGACKEPCGNEEVPRCIHCRAKDLIAGELPEDLRQRHANFQNYMQVMDLLVRALPFLVSDVYDVRTVEGLLLAKSATLQTLINEILSKVSAGKIA